MIGVSQALEIIEANATPLPAEEVALAEALGRVLASDLQSAVDWPPFDTSAMDGYAVRLPDVRAPGARLPEREKPVMAGDPPPGPLPGGVAVRVMTGAPIPEGTQAVIPVEHARREGGMVAFDEVPSPGAHLRRRGESIRAGSILVAAGRKITPGEIALAALTGAGSLSVRRLPRIAVAATGNELVPAGQSVAPGQIRDSNGPMLAALCEARGWKPRRLANAADDETGLAGLFSSPASDVDVLVTSGGVSAGDLDLVPRVARRAGFEILFHGVAMRPGKPVAFGRRGQTLWFGLPGNPVSSSVTFHLFARHALDCLEGHAKPGARRVRLPLVADLRRGGARETYLDAKISGDGGPLGVAPLLTAGSHDIRTHAGADALIRIPAGAGPQPAGTVVECVLL